VCLALLSLVLPGLLSPDAIGFGLGTYCTKYLQDIGRSQKFTSGEEKKIGKSSNLSKKLGSKETNYAGIDIKIRSIISVKSLI